ncbi:MAG: FliM/FliN family flagellar motor switch protein [Terriglobia bacterium]
MEEHAPVTQEPGNADSPQVDNAWLGVLGLPCVLSLELSVAGFKVRDLLALSAESIIDSRYNATGHVPVCVNGVKVAMAEFDVLQTRVAIRLSEVD